MIARTTIHVGWPSKGFELPPKPCMQELSCTIICPTCACDCLKHTWVHLISVLLILVPWLPVVSAFTSEHYAPHRRRRPDILRACKSDVAWGQGISFVPGNDRVCGERGIRSWNAPCGCNTCIVHVVSDGWPYAHSPEDRNELLGQRKRTRRLLALVGVAADCHVHRLLHPAGPPILRG